MSIIRHRLTSNVFTAPLGEFEVYVRRYNTATYVNSVSYGPESIVAFSVSTGENDCTVSYGKITKTVPANSTNYSVIFGKYTGVEDGTPARGKCCFSQGFTSVAPLYFNYMKNTAKYCDCILGIQKWWGSDITSIPDNFMRSQTLHEGDIEIPSHITSIGSSAFNGAKGRSMRFLGNGITSIGDANAFNFSDLTTLYMDDRYMDNCIATASSGRMKVKANKKVYTALNKTFTNGAACTYGDCTVFVVSWVTKLPCALFGYVSGDTKYSSTIDTLRILGQPPEVDLTNSSGTMSLSDYFANTTSIEVQGQYLYDFLNSDWGVLSAKIEVI